MLANHKEKMAVIHIAKKQCTPDDECYREILYSCAGVSSASEIKTEAQFNAVMDAFENLGFKKNLMRKRKLSAPHVPGMITSRQEYYIKGLWKLASRKKDEKSLMAMVRRIGKVDDISFLEVKNAAAVIQALRNICNDAGFNPDQKACV